MPSSGSMIHTCLGVGVLVAPGAFLGEDRVIRVDGVHRLDDRGLGRAVDLADEILRTLGRDRQQVEVARAASDDVAGAACGLDGRGQHRMHGRFARAWRSRRVSEGGGSRILPCTYEHDVQGGARRARDARESNQSADAEPARVSTACASCSCARACPATSARRRARCRRWASRDSMLVAPARFPDADATALASGATAVLDAARVVPTLDVALAGTRMSIGILGAAARIRRSRAAAARGGRGGGRPGGERRRRAGVRHRDVRPHERRARALHGRWRRFAANPAYASLNSRRPCRSPPTSCASPRWATACGSRRASRRRRTTTSRRCTRTRSAR